VVVVVVVVVRGRYIVRALHDVLVPLSPQLAGNVLLAEKFEMKKTHLKFFPSKSDRERRSNFENE